MPNLRVAASTCSSAPLLRVPLQWSRSSATLRSDLKNAHKARTLSNTPLTGVRLSMVFKASCAERPSSFGELAVAGTERWACVLARAAEPHIPAVDARST